MRNNKSSKKGAGLSIAIIVMLVFAIMSASFASYTAVTSKVNIKTANSIQNELVLESVDYKYLYKYLDENLNSGTYTYQDISDISYNIILSEIDNTNNTVKITITAYLPDTTTGYFITYDITNHTVIAKGSATINNQN